MDFFIEKSNALAMRPKQWLVKSRTGENWFYFDERTRETKSIYPVGALKFANIENDLIEFRVGYSLDGRHVSKLPMVRTCAVLGGHVKRRITMMVWLIDLMDQGRRDPVLSGCIFTVA